MLNKRFQLTQEDGERTRKRREARQAAMAAFAESWHRNS
jgi:hypothetical protein